MYMLKMILMYQNDFKKGQEYQNKRYGSICRYISCRNVKPTCIYLNELILNPFQVSQTVIISGLTLGLFKS